ncbi:ANTAR domain-containing protein [Kineosporia rhizophila]|uniref:ANTAR domain-containing protein n=1 Tax=Kineosporia rhizophila TaxID=84633 RepID=UPI001E467B54|nr:ANTAR domain-containing protein [Kineosporia rhizophila]MCE0537151.1 ANTAR domain-containing protein [Kineosporia rhizophila]
MSQNQTLDEKDQPPVVSTAGPARPPNEALLMLRSAHQALLSPAGGRSWPPSSETLSRVADDLALAEEELTVQLAELDTAARARTEGRALTRQMLDSLPVAVVTTSPAGSLLEVNPAAQELLQVPVGRLENQKPVFAFVAPDDRRAARDLLHSALHGTTAAHASLRLLPRGGSPVVCDVAAARSLPEERTAQVRWILQPVPGSDPADPADPAYRETLVELARLGVGDTDLPALLRRVAELAVQAAPAVQSASLLLGDPADPDSIVSTSPLAQAGDGLQYMIGSGPMFEAYATGSPVATSDALDDPRWPDLARVAGGTASSGSWLALPLVLEEKPIGLLMLYGEAGHTFGEPALAQLAPFVQAAATLVRDSRTIQEMRSVQEQLRQALASRAVIDQAKGMIMLSRRCSAEDAFAVLVRMSNDSNRKIRELAAELVAAAVQGRPPVP